MENAGIAAAVDRWFTDNQERVIGWRRHIHSHPELSNEEVATTDFLVETLESYGLHPVRFPGTGLYVDLGPAEGKRLAFRADIDALRVAEQTGLSFASSNPGVSHSCGHDIHTTALLSMCDFLDNTRQQWSGTFIALFQPGEEIGAGAQDMADGGLTEKVPAPDVVFGQHVMPGRAGEVMSKPGPQFAACDSIRIKIPGRAAHGSMPHNAIDPTYTAAMIIARLQAIVGREVDPADFAVVTVASMHAGTTNNIIPGEAELVLNCRFYSDRVKAKVYSAIKRVVHAEVLASGSLEQAMISFFAHGELLDNDEEVFTRVRGQFDGVFGDASVTADPKTVSEDFPVIGQAYGAPYFFWLVGCTPHDVWDKAVEEDRVGEDVPVNHMSTFLPEYEPTIDASTRAGLTAALSYLAK